MEASIITRTRSQRSYCVYACEPVNACSSFERECTRASESERARERETVGAGGWVDSHTLWWSFFANVGWRRFFSSILAIWICTLMACTQQRNIAILGCRDLDSLSTQKRLIAWLQRKSCHPRGNSATEPQRPALPRNTNESSPCSESHRTTLIWTSHTWSNLVPLI